eukprot:UN0149
MTLPEKARRLRPEDFLSFDEARKVITFQAPVEGDKKLPFEVSLAGARHSQKLAERVAVICFEKLRDGVPKKEVEAFRQQMYTQCQAMSCQDVPGNCVAWQKCKGSAKYANPAVTFTYEYSNGKKDCFQTTATATGGRLMEAERIARLCYKKFESGMKKDDVLAYRAKLYQELANASAAAATSNKRQRTS